jgi:uncharacterized protein (DUF2147 family)
MKTMLVLVASALLLGATVAVQAASIEGTWLSESGKTKIKMAPCGSKYCGTIVWVQGPETKDVKNKEESKRGRNLVGLQMVYDMVPEGAGYKGSLYNYDDGGTYTGTMTPDGADKVKLKGCWTIGFPCRTSTWSRSN